VYAVYPCIQKKPAYFGQHSLRRAGELLLCVSGVNCCRARNGPALLAPFRSPVQPMVRSVCNYGVVDVTDAVRSLMRSPDCTASYTDTVYAGSSSGGDDGRSIMMRLQSPAAAVVSNANAAPAACRSAAFPYCLATMLCSLIR